MAKRWYVVHTYSGYENKVKADLEHRIETFGMDRQIVDIQIPTEEVNVLNKDGKETPKESKIFPGYVLVRMDMDDNSWSVVRNTPGVTGFAGLDGTPTPLSRDEFNKIMRRSKHQVDTPRVINATYEVGESIKVTSGPLEGFDGTISEILTEPGTNDANEKIGKVRVLLTIFGRETPVELTLDQIQSI